MEIINWDLAIRIITLIILLIGAGKGIKELIRAQKWKQAEFLANEYKDFTNNDYVKAAFIMLDGFSLNIPYTNSEGKPAVIHFEKEKFKKALTNLHLNKPKNRSYNTEIE